MPNRPKFNLGKLVATPAAIRAMDGAGITALDLLSRHLAGDWGDCSTEDKQANNGAVKGFERIFSSYQINPELKIWVITEADRSSTCILLPEDY